jgi:tRNA threonylcarbamoyladenosine biosynthesis protein TsaB
MILSIETSTEVCSIAIHTDGKLLAESTSFESYSHAEKLAPMIRETLADKGLVKADLTAIAVSAGPGSYTGLRIGTSTAKGLCYALDLPLITVNTLESMLEGLSPEYKQHWKCPMIDARRMEVYCLLATQDKTMAQPVEAKIIDENSFGKELKSHKILFYGNGANKCRSVITSENAMFLEGITPHARNIGIIASRLFEQQKFADLAYFEPDYLKPYIAIKAKNPLQ